MRKLIIATHSTLAKGFKETLDFLTGKNDHIQALTAYVDAEHEDVDQLITKWLKGHESDEFYILTDMMGGSVNQKIFPYVSDRVHLISGVNLPLAMTIALQLNSDKPIDINQAIHDSQKQIIYMNTQLTDVNDEDE